MFLQVDKALVVWRQGAETRFQRPPAKYHQNPGHRMKPLPCTSKGRQIHYEKITEPCLTNTDAKALNKVPARGIRELPRGLRGPTTWIHPRKARIRHGSVHHVTHIHTSQQNGGNTTLTASDVRARRRYTCAVDTARVTRGRGANNLSRKTHSGLRCLRHSPEW